MTLLKRIGNLARPVVASALLAAGSFGGIGTARAEEERARDKNILGQGLSWVGDKVEQGTTLLTDGVAGGFDYVTGGFLGDGKTHGCVEGLEFTDDVPEEIISTNLESKILSIPKIKTEEKKSEKAIAVRTYMDQTSQGQNSFGVFRLGLAQIENGKRQDEFFRMYRHFSNIQKDKGKNKDWTSAALTTPEFSLWEIKNQATIFGNFGYRKGIGFVSTHKLEDFILTLNAERQEEPTEATRLGVGLDYMLMKNLMIGGAFDTVVKTVKDKDVRDNYGLVHLVYDLDNQNQFGAALRVADFGGKTKDKNEVSALGYWTHYNDKWGTRTWLKFVGASTYHGIQFDSIIAQNPTFGPGSGPWLVGRTAGDMFDLGVVENPMAPERVPLGNRTKGGWVFDLRGSYFDRETGTSSALGVEGGYKFNLNKDVSLTPTLFYDMREIKSKMGGKTKDDSSYGGSLLLKYDNILRGKLGNPSLELEGRYTRFNDEMKEPEFFGSVGVWWEF